MVACARYREADLLFFGFRMLIRSSNDKIDVNIDVRNSKDNAYNTKVTLSFTPNINFINAEVRFPPFF